MRPDPIRVLAAILLGLSATFMVVLVMAIVTAFVLVAGGLPVGASDRALLEDLVAISPFIAAFAIGAIVAVVGLAAGWSWADAVGMVISVFGVTVAMLALLLMGLGADLSEPGVADGFAIVTVLLAIHLVALIALVLDRSRRQPGRASGRLSVSAL
jgi:hypothetical protein